MKIILASTSKYRKAQLKNFGLTFDTCSPKIDEEELKKNKLEPKHLVEYLAREKALSVQSDYPEDIVIGCDQMAVIGSHILDKPGTVERAVEQLSSLNDRTHELLTSICVVHKDRKLIHTDITQLRLKFLTEEQIRNYVNFDNPIDCAGSYKIEKSGLALFEKIESNDFSAIQGVPLMALSQILIKLKFPLPFL